WGSAVEEPVDGVREARLELGVHVRMPIQLGIVLDQVERALPGTANDLEVFGQARQLEVGQARLAHIEQGALSTQPKVLVRQEKPVGCALHRPQPGACLAIVLSALVEQEAERAVLSPADPATELV